MTDGYIDVAVNTPFNRSLLSYKIPNDLPAPTEGTLLWVPLGKRKERACVLGVASEVSTEYEIKEYLGEYELPFKVANKELELYRWISRYYHYPLGQLIFDTLPKPMKRARTIEAQIGVDKGDLPRANAEQLAHIHKITQKLEGFEQWLLHGITGSGKTLVYLHTIKEVLKSGKSALFLVPEINLTPQFIKNFSDALDVPILSYNSALSDSERLGAWVAAAVENRPCLLIGVRSSIFLPIHNLGLIIVDEEHDNSFKQDDRCPYNARDVAVKKAQIYDIPVILGSATPSMETFHRFNKLKPESYLSLEKRAGQGELPKIDLVDCRDEEYGEHWPISSKSLSALREALSKGEQALVYINRLGYASFVQCSHCGHQFECPNCSVALKYYKAKRLLDCHYCDYKVTLPDECPECRNMKLVHHGYGTEKVAEVIKTQIANARVGRFDREELTTFNKVKERMEQFNSGELDILVGTQMISKGHNFKRVNLVIVLGTDSVLNLPDFRAAEKVYQQLTQVSGRAGRYSSHGKVMVETLCPENQVFQLVKESSFNGFYQMEDDLRQRCGYPPYQYLALIQISAGDQAKVIKTAQEARERLEWKKLDIEVLGPRPAVIERRVNKYTWILMVRSTDRNQLHQSLASLWPSSRWPHSSIGLKVDIDPQNIN